MFPAFEKYRIDTLSALLLAALTLAGGVSVYVAMQKQVESLLVKSLEVSLQHNVQLVENQIDQSLSKTQTVSTRLNPIKHLQLLESTPGNATAKAELQKIARSFLSTGFTGMYFYDVLGHEVAHAGHFSQRYDLRVPLKIKDRAFLLWDEQFILHVSVDVLDQQGRRIGMVMTEAHLPHLTLAFGNVASIGKTGEFAV